MPQSLQHKAMLLRKRNPHPATGRGGILSSKQRNYSAMPVVPQLKRTTTLKNSSKDKQETGRLPANALRVTNTRRLQERRIRGAHGLSASHAELIAALAYGEVA